MANDEGYCWPSVSSLEQRTGLSERTIRAKIQELEAACHVEKSERPGRSTVYRITPHGEQLDLIESGGEGCKSRRGANSAGVQSSQGRGATVAPGGANLAGEGCKSRTQIHKRSDLDPSKETGARDKSPGDKSGSVKSSRHASHQEFKTPDWQKKPIDREGLHRGMQQLKALVGGQAEGAH